MKTPEQRAREWRRWLGSDRFIVGRKAMITLDEMEAAVAKHIALAEVDTAEPLREEIERLRRGDV